MSRTFGGGSSLPGRQECGDKTLALFLEAMLPICGAWESRSRRKVWHPHAQFFFWRTADGAEIDLVIERGSQRVAVEIKAGRGDKIHAARVLERAMADVGVKPGWILDQAEGTDALRPALARRSFTADPEWLP